MFSFEKKALILALLCGTTLAALPGPSEGAALEALKAGFGSISGNQAPLWVAKEARLFEKQGLEVELVYIPGAPGLSWRFSEAAYSFSITRLSLR
jgi:ABC-type nitrate/sulfonate/bicarbonate transport system substrate-binding protein